MTKRLGFGGLSADRRSVVLAAACLLGGLVIGSGWAAGQTVSTWSDTGWVPERATAAPSFPLAISPDNRYLVDAAGRPFFIQGDAAWGLIAQLTREDVEQYLDDRRARGFNTLLVRLLEHRFVMHAPANAYGEQPFRGPLFEALAWLAGVLPFKKDTSFATLFADYSAPNEAYFAHVDWVLRRAAEKGFLVLLTPSYTGSGGTGEGWYRAMVANGPDRLRQYGEYLGRRFRDFKNILWVHAGDFDPPRKDLVRAIANGIREFDPRALHTVHSGPETSVFDYWRGETWLQVNTIYTYKPVYAAALDEYARPEPMPFFLIESTYENEHEATEQRLRTQAYQAVLSGAAGQVFGNNPIWHFDGRGLYPAPETWQEALGSRGAQSMTHLHDLLMGIRWWLLKPDTNNALLTSGLGGGFERAVAARITDRSLAIIYMPTSREITVDLRQLAGPQVAARWYDPSAGLFSAVGGSPFAAAGPQQFTPAPSNNSSGFDDWVLLLESHS